MKKIYNLFLVLLILLYSSTVAAQNSPKYEFRGVWVATVINIDWPSKKGLPVEQQKAEFIKIIDMHKRNGMNALIVQVRPVADAFYLSELEPWSEYLTGKQGKAPEPFYDPLTFMIEETHKKGMEFHAWLNPYRAVFDIKESSVASNHVTRTHPEWFVTYDGKKYFDPGNPLAIKHVVNVVQDLIKRYDLDGIHMDDYFYPYRIPGKAFPDKKTYQKHGKGLSLEAWRRSNCDSIVKQIYEVIVNTNPSIKFGISPFGVWRNKSKDPEGSNTKAGQTNYDDLYADILLWLKKGWIDYIVPQLYWEIGHNLCDYKTLVDWWASHSYGKHVYVGHGMYRAGSTTAWKNFNEIPNEIAYLRKNNNIHGSVYFSSKNFESNPNGWNDSLRNNYYRYPALLPPTPWIDSLSPDKPSIINAKINRNRDKEDLIIEGKIENSVLNPAKKVVVYLSNTIDDLGKKPYHITVPDKNDAFDWGISLSEIPSGWNDCYIAVSGVNKLNNESPLSNIIQLKPARKGWKIQK